MEKNNKSLLHLSWETAFFWEGCPLCFLVQKSLRSYMENILYESVNDPSLRKEIREKGGFCEEHSLQLFSFNDLLGISIIYEDIIKNYTLPNLRKKIIANNISCIFCEKEKEYERLYILALEEVLRNKDSFELWKENAYDFCQLHKELIKNTAPNLYKKIEPFLNTKKRKYPEYIYKAFPWDRDFAELFLKKLQMMRYNKIK
jgi:hypothetical protein